MNNQKQLARTTAGLLIAGGLFIFLLYLYFFVPFGEVVSAFQEANLLYYSLAFGALILSVTFSSLTWQRLLKTLLVNSSFVKAFQFIWIGYFVDLLIPGESVSSDVSRIYLMSRGSGQDAGRVTASVVAHRFLSTVIPFAGLIISSTYFMLRYHPPLLLSGFIAVITGTSAIVLVSLFYFSTNKKATERITHWVINLLGRLSRGRWHLERLRQSATEMLQTFHEGIDTLGKRPKALVLPVVLSTLAWVFDLLIVALVFYSLGSLGAAPLSVIVIVYFIIVGIEDIPLGIPAGVGLMEIAMTSLYTLFGVPIAMSAAATVLIRVMTFWVKLLIGGLTVQWLGIKTLRA